MIWQKPDMRHHRSTAASALQLRHSFALRLVSLPKGDQARELVGAANSGIGHSLESFLGCSGRREETVLLETAEPFDATTIVEAKHEAETSPRASHLHGRIARGGGSHRVCSHLEERPDVEEAHGSL